MEGTRRVVKVFIGSEALALVITLVSQALTLYGIISISMARVFLILAWVVAVLGVLVSDCLYEKSWRHMVAITSICGVLLAAALIGLDQYAVRKKAQQEAANKPPEERTKQQESAPPQKSQEVQQQSPQVSAEKHKIVKKKPGPPQSVSTGGANSPSVGSISQGAGGAVSINQQGGITAGTIIGEIPPPPRTLSPPDAANLTALLSKYPSKILILYTQHDNEAYHLAKQIGDALTAAGWTLHQPVTEAMIMSEGGGPLYGMEVSYKGDKPAAPGSHVQLDPNTASGALTNTLFHLFPDSFTANPTPNRPDDEIMLDVFTNPQAKHQ